MSNINYPPFLPIFNTPFYTFPILFPLLIILYLSILTVVFNRYQPIYCDTDTKLTTIEYEPDCNAIVKLILLFHSINWLSAISYDTYGSILLYIRTPDIADVLVIVKVILLPAIDGV